MEIVWGTGVGLCDEDDANRNPPVMEMIRHAAMAERITRHPIKKIILTKAEKKRFDREVEFGKQIVKPDVFLGIELEVA